LVDDLYCITVKMSNKQHITIETVLLHIWVFHNWLHPLKSTVQYYIAKCKIDIMSYGSTCNNLLLQKQHDNKWCHKLKWHTSMAWFTGCYIKVVYSKSTDDSSRSNGKLNRSKSLSGIYFRDILTFFCQLAGLRRFHSYSYTN